MNTSNFDARQAEQAHLLQVYAQSAIEPVRADGVWLYTRDGRKILDMYGGHAVAALGYNHAEVIKALQQQAEQLFFQSNAVALEVRARAADKLAAFAPANLNTVFLVNSGAEANENALRLALKHTGRCKVLAVEHGFHGRTAAAGAVTWGADKWYGFPQKPFAVDFIPRNNAAAAAQMIDTSVGAVIIELVQGVAGAFDLDPEFAKAIETACKQHAAVLIVDEVQTGVGRCGTPFATDLYNVEADILTTAKALGTGFPCGALLLTDAMTEGLAVGDLGTTFGGGPLACALIDTVISVIERDKLLDNVKRLSARLKTECITGPVTAVSGKGFLLGLHCPQGAHEVSQALLEQDIMAGSSGDPNVLRFLPPLTLADEHVDRVVAALQNI